MTRDAISFCDYVNRIIVMHAIKIYFFFVYKEISLHK